ncbi:cytochrome P450 [Hypoxylon rubiginosum]|uniref:Cytochrome P450 n=1 Tax=Hypoxylon rubiginosum TaxID=110542 RepID=A0ACB9YJU6_9PEZI|nr:cytochrome P450 [Hypoxylon rubiginosum]
MLSVSTLQWDGVSLLCLLLLVAYHDAQTQDETSGINLPSKRPPTLPSYVPFIDHLIQFITNGSALLSKASKFSGASVPVRISLPGFSSYVVSGPEAVTAFFKNTRDLSTTSRGVTIIQNAFGCPAHLAHHFKPRYSLDGAPDEVEQAIHRGVQTGLSGPQLEILASRFQISLLEKIGASQQDIGNDWVEIPDLCDLVQKYVIESVIYTFFGPYMISLNPHIVQDFLEFNDYIRLLFMSMPRWLIPKAYKARQRMVDNIQRWQKHARENCDLAELGDVDWEPYYGSRFIRERQALLTRRGILDETARAAENFANLWAANSNSVPAAIWFLVETIRDTSLKEEVYQRVSSALLIPEANGEHENGHATFDIEKLCCDPLLQSVYAETLRLRVAALIVREAAQRDFSFCGWRIKKGEVLTVSSHTEAMNQEVWGVGGDLSSHALDKFWSHRFLVNPDDSNSGPLRNPRTKRAAGNKDLSFSTDGLAGTWIPYGGGRSLCPGRHFAKREIMLTTAAFLTAYEIDLNPDTIPSVNMSHFGFGTMPPKGKLPCRIRRRPKEGRI